LKITGNEASDNKIYKLLYQSSSDAIMIIEPPDWKFISGNQSTIKMFGLKSEEEFISLSPKDLSPKLQPDGQISAEKSIKMIEKALKNGSASFEWTHKRSGGDNFSATVLLTKLTIGDKYFLQATIRDTTESKKSDQKYRSLTKELETMIDNVPAWIFYKDDKNNFLRVNKAFCEVMGKEKKDLEGKSSFDLFPKKQADAYLADDLEVIKAGKPKLNIVESMPSKTGMKWVKTDKIPLYSEEGKIIGIIGFTIDISIQKETEIKLYERVAESEKLNKMMVGRELKMIELKEEIKKLRQGTQKQEVETAGSSDQEETIFDKGIRVEESVIHKLHDHFVNVLKNSTLAIETKSKALRMVEILSADSEKHEGLLTELSNARR